MSSRHRILVTGGAGFIGSHLVDRLVSLDCKVTVLDNLSTGILANVEPHMSRREISFVKGDIKDSKTIRKCVTNADAVVHLAAITSVPLSVKNPALTQETNVEGTLGLLNSCVSAGAGKFVFVSSCAVYGEPSCLPVKEDDPTCPISPYAASKMQGECDCVDFQKRNGLKTVILRLFNVYGPRQVANEYSGVMAKFFERARQGLPLVIYGDGTQTRDFVHVWDVVTAIVRVLGDENAEGQVFNIGFGRPVSVNELAKSVLDLVGVDLGIVYERPRKGDLKHSFADVSKAKTLLGYNPKVCLAEGLRTVFGLSATVADET
jgi:UDP-glucose 4-epimerase